MLSGVNVHPSSCYTHQVPRVLGVPGVKLQHLGDMELQGPWDTYQNEGWRGQRRQRPTSEVLQVGQAR